MGGMWVRMMLRCNVGPGAGEDERGAEEENGDSEEEEEEKSVEKEEEMRRLRSASG